MRFATALSCALAVLLVQFAPARAMDVQRPVVLRSDRGIVNYQPAGTTTQLVVDGSLVFDEKAYASTQADSIGVLEFPDTSQLTLAPNSAIQVYDFLPRKQHVFRKRYAYFWDGSTIRLPSTSTTLRLDVRQPDGGDSDYVVLTRFARIDVHGTSALLSDSTGGDIVTCLDCGAGDIVANIAGEDYVVGNGETLVVTQQGRISLVATTGIVMQGFASSGLSTDRLPQPEPQKRFRFQWTPPFAKHPSS